MNLVMKILAILILIAIGTGFYFRLTGDVLMGDRLIGIGVIVAALVLMPIFLAVRWRGKKLEDYTLSDKNIKKMRDKGLD